MGNRRRSSGETSSNSSENVCLRGRMRAQCTAMGGKRRSGCDCSHGELAKIGRSQPGRAGSRVAIVVEEKHIPLVSVARTPKGREGGKMSPARMSSQKNQIAWQREAVR